MTRHSLAMAALALALALPACARHDAPSPQGPGRGGGGGRPAVVTTLRVQPVAFSDAVDALGTVKARESVTLTSKVGETVQAVHFDSGDTVRAGAPLVTLSGQAQHAALVEAQAAADEAERLYRRQSELAAQQLIARAALDTQRAARDAARARVAQVRAQLGDRVIRAPFAGVLGLRQVSPGALVTPGTPIATLDDIASVYVDFPVPETELAAAAEGARVEGRVASQPGRRFDGVVQVVAARLDAGTRAATVRARFANAGRVLRPGMLMQVRLLRGERQALRVPEIAVVQVGADSYVFRVGAGDKVERVDVRTGVRSDGQVEIREGLAAGDRIVVDGTGKLKPGDAVSEAGAARAGGRR